MRICMVAYAFYESDTRIMQYAAALTERGDQVDVIALRREGQAEFEVVGGVNVFRVQSRTVNEGGLFSYGYRICKFLLHCLIVLNRNHGQNPYQFIHVHSVPDFLIFAALVPKLKGVPIVLDIHDLLPEFYASKFNVASDSLIFKLMVMVERVSARFANHVIIANHLWRKRLIERSVSADKCTAIRNYPDLNIFISQKRNRGNPKTFRITYPGSLNWHQGVDVAIRAFARVADNLADTEFHIYGEGPAKPSLIALAKELRMNDRVIFHDFLPSTEVARVMAESDLAVEPKRATSQFGNEAASTKILEFMALGVPIIASRTTIHAYYYDGTLIKYYDSDDVAQLAGCIVEMKSNVSLRESFARNAAQYARKNNWQVCRTEYLQLVDALSISDALKTKASTGLTSTC